MTISGFVEYVKQIWKNKPDRTTPITAATLTHMEDGIKGNSDAINEIAQAVVDNIVNDPQKIASMASLYAVNESVKKNASDIKDVNNNLSKAAIKSDLFSSGSITNPNTCTVPFSLVNGWHSAITNVPDAAKGKYSILLNIWEYGPSSAGNLTSNHMQALIIEKGGGIFTRLYINSAWSDWA